jgi:hypothetical protein
LNAQKTAQQFEQDLEAARQELKSNVQQALVAN